MRSRLTYANVMSTVAVFLAVGLGGAWAANGLKKNSVSSKQVKNESILSKDLKNAKAVAGTDVKDDSIGSNDLTDGSVASADVANGSIGSADLTADEALHFAGGAGEPAISSGAENDCLWNTLNISPGTAAVNPASFYKDQRGRVHLSGTMQRSNGPGGDAACTNSSNAEGVEDLTIFVLPPAYRPDRLSLFTDSAGQGVLVTANEDATNSLGATLPAGSVIGQAASGVAALDGISFPAASGPATTGAPAPPTAGAGSAADVELPALLGD